jgi:hypothetical protein
MKKLIIGAVAALTAMVAAPASAAPVTPPDHVKMVVVKVGKLDTVTKVAPITAGTVTTDVKMSECTVQWISGDEFYLMGSNGSVILIPKKMMDMAWTESKEDWNISFNALLATNLICNAVPVK